MIKDEVFMTDLDSTVFELMLDGDDFNFEED